MKMNRASLLLLLLAFVSPTFGGSIFELQIKKEESAADVFGRFQELREIQNPDCGRIFMTPEIAEKKWAKPQTEESPRSENNAVSL